MVSTTVDCCKSSFSSFATLQIVLILVLSILRDTRAKDYDHEEKFCPVDASVDLTYATPNASGFIAESGHFFPREAAKFRDGVLRGCICDTKPCLTFCPPAKIARTKRTRVINDFVNYKAIPLVHTTNLTIEDDEETRGPEERFHSVIWYPCEGRGAYFLEPNTREEDEYYLLKNGSLFLPRMNKSANRFLGLTDYCLRLLDNDTTYIPKVCAKKVKEEKKKDELTKAIYIGALVAVPFILATVIVYSVSPKLRNTHGKILISYLCCLIVAYAALAADRIPTADSSPGVRCFCLGFTIYFSFLATFLWLNVMCFDMWWRFGGFGPLRTTGAHDDRKKFIGYSIYAWGSAVILTAICIGLEFTPSISGSLFHPGFKLNACWFKSKTAAAAALYFYGPIGVTIVCNIYFFISISIKMIRHKKQTQRYLENEDNKRNNNYDSEQRFNLQLKLFVIMGISWSTEVISFFCKGPEYLWLITDMINAFQGLFIFVIFVCKKNIWQSLPIPRNIVTLPSIKKSGKKIRNNSIINNE